jgi:hypothetical protein
MRLRLNPGRVDKTRMSFRGLAQAALYLVIVVMVLGAWRVLGLWSIPFYVAFVWLAFNGIPRRIPRRRR